MKSHGNKGFDAPAVSLIAGVHFLHDVFTAFLAPILPLLINKFDLSMALAGTLAVFTQLPSLFSPFFGSLLDRFGFTRRLMVISPAVTSTAICLVGLMPDYTALALLLLFGGLGVAGIHLAAPVVVAEFSGDELGKGTSLFMVAGELARTAGPLLAVGAVSLFGLEGLWMLLPVGVGASLLAWSRVRRMPRRNDAPGAGDRGTGTGMFLALWKMKRTVLAVAGIMAARACVSASVTVYLPTLLYEKGQSLAVGGGALSLFELAGSLGAYVAGTVSDRLGRRLVLFVTMSAAPTLMLLFLWSSGALVVIFLLAMGFFVLGTTPVALAVMLETTDNNKALASGMFMTVGFALRSVLVPAFGALSDSVGLDAAYHVFAVAAYLGLPFLLFLGRKTR
ncbi:MAG: MFS transporter [Deltaproteobacteria bacterium]|nr:MFS transporter [Deltaproteobacteria bacterium]